MFTTYTSTASISWNGSSTAFISFFFLAVFLLSLLVYTLGVNAIYFLMDFWSNPPQREYLKCITYILTDILSPFGSLTLTELSTFFCPFTSTDTYGYLNLQFNFMQCLHKNCHFNFFQNFNYFKCFNCEISAASSHTSY